jgi:hypothetical protein
LVVQSFLFFFHHSNFAQVGYVAVFQTSWWRKVTSSKLCSLSFWWMGSVSWYSSFQGVGVLRIVSCGRRRMELKGQMECVSRPWKMRGGSSSLNWIVISFCAMGMLCESYVVPLQVVVASCWIREGSMLIHVEWVVWHRNELSFGLEWYRYILKWFQIILFWLVTVEKAWFAHWLE